jgi:hypothetical protein
MLFVATHNVTADDVARAARLGARKQDIFLGIVVVLVLVGILAQVFYSFWLYLSAAAGAPQRFLAHLRFETGEPGVAVMSWLSILVSLLLPIFLFYAVRSLADALHPGRRVRRLAKKSDITGPTTYTIDDRGVRSVGAQGAETFLPWSAFDAVRSDAEIAVLLSKARPRFFLPLEAVGRERNNLLAEIKSRISRSAWVTPMSTIPPSWKAEFEGRTLHIYGVVKYPNDFSTASLERVDEHGGPDVVSYRVVFHRDKEPFCGPDLIGPLHYIERDLPAGAARIRITLGTGQVEFPIKPAGR